MVDMIGRLDEHITEEAKEDRVVLVNHQLLSTSIMKINIIAFRHFALSKLYIHDIHFTLISVFFVQSLKKKTLLASSYSKTSFVH